MRQRGTNKKFLLESKRLSQSSYFSVCGFGASASVFGGVILGMSTIGSGGGVDAIVYPIHPRMANRIPTPRKAVIRIVHSHAQGK